MDIKMIDVTRRCILCGKTNTLSVSEEPFVQWRRAGQGDPMRFVQNAFPEMSAAHREFLINGSCPDGVCFNEAFGED